MAENNNYDLLEPLSLEIDDIPQVQRRRKVEIPDKKEIRLREKQAKRFLCFVLSFVIVFVGVVCIFANNNNKKYEAQQKLLEAQNAVTVEGIDVNATAATTAATTQAKTTAETGSVVKIETTAPSTTIATTTATTLPITTTPVAPQQNNAVGTMDNPVIVTDCSFSTAVVNRNYRIPSSYDPDLVYVCGSGERLQREVAAQYEAMYNAGRNDGVTLTPCSGYRSYSTQETLYNRKVDLFTGQGYSYDEARVKAATIVMIPGSSEHNLGYAMDIVCVEEWFETTDEFRWLMEHAADYGFILRYPKDKQEITKVIYEPWHWRYVGVETAKAIKASGLVMEEYYNKPAQ